MKQIVALLVVVLIGISLLPIQHSESPTFADPLFRRLWTNHSSAGGPVDLWGQEPLLWRVEPYADAPDGRRIVQYFDRGRMEKISAGDQGSEVTQGLLALEITTGEINLGTELREYQPPPTIPLDGGDPDPRVVTYAGLHAVTGERSPNRSGRLAIVDTWIDAHGSVATGNAPAPVRLTHYIAESGHNLPDVTYELLQQSPFAHDAWIETLGYPISEPYWTIYRRNGAAVPSLIQVFERRILVYTPSHTAGKQFTVANVGRHYYRWRYGSEAPTQWAGPLAGSASQAISVPEGYQAGVFAEDLGTPVGLATGVGGELWIVNQQGELYRVDSEQPDGSAGEITQVATGLANPRGIAVHGDAVYVAVDGGIVRPVDDSGDGVADRIMPISDAVEPANGSRGAPAVDDGSGRILIAGIALPDRGAQMVGRVGPDGHLERLIDELPAAGPITTNDGVLYSVRPEPDGSTAIHRHRLSADGAALTSTETAGTITAGPSVTSILPASTLPWRGLDGEEIFVTTEQDGAGRLLKIEPGEGALSETIEFATGFERPVSITHGIDGSLYIADAGTRLIYKIVSTERPLVSRIAD